MHIHVSLESMTFNDSTKIFNYYLLHQDEIIDQARKLDLYVDLNKYVTETNRSLRRTNLNTVAAFLKHKTIEHRIYKSTIDFDKII